MNKTSLSPLGGPPNKIFASAADYWETPLSIFGETWPAVGGSVLLAGATIEGHKSELESWSPWKNLPPTKYFSCRLLGDTVIVD